VGVLKIKTTVLTDVEPTSPHKCELALCCAEAKQKPDVKFFVVQFNLARWNNFIVTKKWK